MYNPLYASGAVYQYSQVQYSFIAVAYAGDKMLWPSIWFNLKFSWAHKQS